MDHHIVCPPTSALPARLMRPSRFLVIEEPLELEPSPNAPPAEGSDSAEGLLLLLLSGL